MNKKQYSLKRMYKPFTIYNNEDIFKILYPKSNDCLSMLDKEELDYIINSINSFYIGYRQGLGLNLSDSFGIEIETTCDCKKQVLLDFYNNNLNKNWRLYDESTVNHGLEFVPNVLYDMEKTWKELKYVCSLIKSKVHVTTCCGGHIHIGSHVLGSEYSSWLNFIKLWAAYEHVIFRFCYGEYLNARYSLDNYAYAIANDVKNNLKRRDNSKLLLKLSMNDYSAICFNYDLRTDYFERYNTIEFRCPNGTLEPIIWQNNINFFMKLLKYCRSDQFDECIVHEKLNYRYHFLEYGNIYLEDAIELCDMLFDNNLDKVYFLRQYIKDGTVACDNILTKSKNFIKK